MTTAQTDVKEMLAERAGRTLKRTVLELGGFNPMIILDDVDMDYAVRTATFEIYYPHDSRTGPRSLSRECLGP
jgi:acyl-CoA reductase-like NAD-dependent aldehyde dehydrogenase